MNSRKDVLNLATYYHGTSPVKAKSIMDNGIKIGTSEDNTFGPALYLCDELEDAKSFGMAVVSVEVDDSKIYEAEVTEEEIQYEDAEWAKEFARSIVTRGYKIAKITREDGFNEIAIYDISVVNKTEIVWKSPLV